MDKEDIVNYVMDSPENTNPAVLKGMLGQLNGGGGGSGGVLAVTITSDYDEATEEVITELDKTLGEITEAVSNHQPVIFCSDGDESKRVYWLVELRRDTTAGFTNIIGISSYYHPRDYVVYLECVVIGFDGETLTNISFESPHLNP